MSFNFKPSVLITSLAFTSLYFSAAIAASTAAPTPATTPTATETGYALHAGEISSSQTNASVPAMPAPDSNNPNALMTLLAPDAMQWVAAPQMMPAGTQVVLLEGDPMILGPFTMRIKFPANYMLAPASYPGVEHITVISGAINIGVGEKFDSTNGKLMPAGSFIMMQPGFSRYAWGSEETVLQLHGIGPWGRPWGAALNNSSTATAVPSNDDAAMPVAVPEQSPKN